MLYNFTLIFLMVIQINCKLMIFLLFSGQTPDSITESLSKTLYPMINSKVDFFDIEERVVSSDILLEIRREEFEDYLVIDLSFNIVISQMIMEFTENEEIINLVA